MQNQPKQAFYFKNGGVQLILQNGTVNSDFAGMRAVKLLRAA